MITKYFILALSFVIFGCGFNSSDKIKSESTETDTVKILSASPELYPVMISDSSTRDSVSLAASFVRKSITSGIKDNESWQIQKFLEIDSLKSSGQYEKYVSSLDIGQVKESLAWIYDTLSYTNGNAYIWGLTMNSYEACPYFEGKIIYLTTISKEGNYKNTIKILEISSGADAPVFASDWGSCQIENNLKISCRDTSLSGESGDDGYEETVLVPGVRTYELAPDGIIKETANTKGVEIKRRKKIAN